MARITESKGRDYLAMVCEQVGGQSEVARILTAAGARITQSAVSQWVRGESRPEPVMRTALARTLSIAEDDWTTEEEAEIIATVTARVTPAVAPLPEDPADPALDEGRPSMAGAA